MHASQRRLDLAASRDSSRLCASARGAGRFLHGGHDRVAGLHADHTQSDIRCPDSPAASAFDCFDCCDPRTVPSDASTHTAIT